MAKNMMTKNLKEIRTRNDDIGCVAYRHVSRTKSSIKKQKLMDKLFYWGLAFIPLFMLAFTTIFINLNSIVMAFNSYDQYGQMHFVWFDNFAEVLKDYKSDPVMVSSLKNSLIVYVTAVLVQTIIPILFSYYMYKKKWGTDFFKVILFLPSIISSMATVLIFKNITDQAIPTLFPELSGKFGAPEGLGLLSITQTRFPTVLIYYLWMSLGGGMLVILGAMNAVDKSVVEAATLDGVGFFGELWHIVLPKSYPVISIGFITGIVSIFTNEFGLYSFYGENASSDVSTLGYYFLVETKRASDAGYPYWAAWGLIASVIVIPLTFLARYLINKLGPSED